jgi:hypothetical protein
MKLTGGSPVSSSESALATTFKLRRFEMFSSRFCRRISTCCSSRRRRRSSGLRPLLLYSDNRRVRRDRGRGRRAVGACGVLTTTTLFGAAFHSGLGVRDKDERDKDACGSSARAVRKLGSAATRVSRSHIRPKTLRTNKPFAHLSDKKGRRQTNQTRCKERKTKIILHVRCLLVQKSPTIIYATSYSEPKGY